MEKRKRTQVNQKRYQFLIFKNLLRLAIFFKIKTTQVMYLRFN